MPVPFVFKVFSAAAFLVSSWSFATNLWSFEPRDFLKQFCTECHQAAHAEAGLDLTSLTLELEQPQTFVRWERIYDRVLAHEMPPNDAPQPKASDSQSFAANLAKQLSAAHRASKSSGLRRLNRIEYHNTLNDLFGTQVDLLHLLPEDGRAHEFDNIGQALSLSPMQMERYMEGFNQVCSAAIAMSTEPPARKLTRASYADTRGAEQWLDKIWLKLADGAVVLFKDYGYPSGMLREANVAKDGWYTVRVTGYAYQSDRPITFAMGATTFARGVPEPTFGYFELAPGASQTVETQAWIPARYMIKLTPYGITDTNNEIRQQGVREYRGPGLAIQHIEVEGPITDPFPSPGHRLLFDGLPREEIPPRNPKDRERPSYVAKFRIELTDSQASVTPVLQRVATAAFRRPTTSDQLTPYLQLFSQELEQGSTCEEALRAAVTAIFCAPDFLFLREAPGALDDYALASRLAYLLTRTAPDETLLNAAAQTRLTQTDDALVSQAQRLLASERSDRFIQDFTDAWLNLREIEFTNPDNLLYPEFDAFLQWSMLAETRAYFRKLINDNQSVVTLVKSDFAMLNNRLADHYQIPDVSGPAMRPVAIKADSVRGGLLGQAAIHKVSANGTNTSPVVRGVWVMERLLGQVPQPPPPGIPGVEPDVRGAATLRELLDKHRNLETCRSCHAQIDPPGFALESFDPIGGWRERFRTAGNGDRVDLLVRGQKVRYKLGLPVDASGQTSDGQSFAGFVEFRDLLADQPERLARALTTKLLTFATGREMGFSDREEIEQIVAQAAASQYGIRDLLLGAIKSSIFRNK